MEKQKQVVRGVGPVRLVIGLVILIVVGTIWGLFVTGRLMALEVVSGSMDPTIQQGDRLIVGRFANSNVSRGDLIMVIPPDDDGPELIKRIMGLPGDHIQLRGGILTINGQDSTIAGAAPSVHPGAEDQDLQLESGYYYLLGDNRPFSHDSTEFGPVHRSLITGRVLFRYAPMSRFGRLERKAIP